jgi:hypothetical protein
MRIFDSLRGHFSLLTKRQLKTLSEGSPFVVMRVVSTKKREGDWSVVIKPLNGKAENSIYISDILRVYAWIISTKMDKWVTLKDIQNVIEKSGINLAQASYTMALMATFDDVESQEGKDAAIMLVSHRKKFGPPVK